MRESPIIEDLRARHARQAPRSVRETRAMLATRGKPSSTPTDRPAADLVDRVIAPKVRQLRDAVVARTGRDTFSVDDFSPDEHEAWKSWNATDRQDVFLRALVKRSAQWQSKRAGQVWTEINERGETRQHVPWKVSGPQTLTRPVPKALRSLRRQAQAVVNAQGRR